jgi:RimJ/RimL family protein N-acetyltransferase
MLVPIPCSSRDRSSRGIVDGLYTSQMSPTVQLEIRLRRTTDADVRTLHGFELDEAANALAGTKPRDWPTFEARWKQILADLDGTVTRVTPRVILADGVLVGAVNIAPKDGHDSIGYWIDREHWGRGIATRAVALMLAEFTRRPLFATTAGHNHPSIRVLEKNRFEILSRAATPATARTVERETVTLVLR